MWLLSSMKYLLCFITPGHFLLLSSSPAAEASGRCEYHITSPVLPRSNRHCVLQLALYEAGPAAGNLTLLIKPVLSGSTIRSVILTKERRDDHRSANTLRSSFLSFCNAVCAEFLFIQWCTTLIMQHSISI